MLLPLNKIERDMFERLAMGSDGRTLREFADRLVAQLVDIRNIPDGDATVEKKARSLAVKLIEDNISNRLKVLNGEMDGPDEDEWQ